MIPTDIVERSNRYHVRAVTGSTVWIHERAFEDRAAAIHLAWRVAQASGIDAEHWTETRVDDCDHTIAGNHPCHRCAKTGQFITYVENDKPRGPGGICFRCAGKGFHTQDDRKRNNYHDTHQIVHI